MFTETLQQVREAFSDHFEPMSEEEIIQDLVDRFNLYQDSNGLWNCDGSVKLNSTGFARLPLRFGVVKGDFNCVDNKLTTLEGAPQSVGGVFRCDGNTVSVEELKQTVSRTYL